MPVHSVHAVTHEFPVSTVVLQSAMVHSEDPDIQRKIAKIQRKMGGSGVAAGGAGEPSLYKPRRTVEFADMHRDVTTTSRQPRQEKAKTKLKSPRNKDDIIEPGM